MENVNLAVIFYSMGGTNVQMSKWAKEGAEAAGANVRLLKAEELAPKEVIEGNEVWKNTVEATKDIPVATSDDIERSEEHTSELQSRGHLVCRLLLEKQKPT